MFEYKYYDDIIKNFKQEKYNFNLFSENHSQKNDRPLIFLRHDVDIDFYGAAILARIEKDNDVKSSYFFQPNSDFYNMFAFECSKIIAEICKMGHEVGLHFDASLYQTQEELIEYIENTYTYYSHFFSLSKVISFHKPAPFILNENLIIPGYINTYEKRFFKEIGYVSDSNRREFWKQKNWEKILTSNSSLQLLTHPFWWSTDEKNTDEEYKKHLEVIIEHDKKALHRIGGILEHI